MTIASTNNRNDYTGNGATAIYPYGFKIFSATDLLVTKRDTDDVETTLVVNTDYTVSGVGVTAGGNVTLTAGNLPTSYALTIRRVRPLTQNTDIRNQGDFFAEIHEDAFDGMVMIDQQQQEELDRSMKIPETITGVSIDLPIPEALKLFRWNANATALESVTPADISTSVTAVNGSLTLTGGSLSVTRPIRAGIAGGTVDALTATFSPTITALTDNNLIVIVEAIGANTSTTPTFAPDGMVAKTIVRVYGGTNIPLGLGDISGADAKLLLALDTTLDKWVLLNPALLPQLTTTQRNSLTAIAGMIIYNTTTARIQHYVGANWYDTVDINSTDTLANKTLVLPKMLTSGAIVDGGGDEFLEFVETVTPVNHMRIENANIGSGPKFSSQGTDINIDLQLEAKGAGKVKFVSGCVGTLDTSKVKDTSYLADTDLIITAYVTSDNADGIEALTDTANPPTTIIAKDRCSGTAGQAASVFMVVRKGDYWKVAHVTPVSGTVVVRVRPLG